MTVKIVTDSVSDIPSDLAKSLDITMVPLTVNFGVESFLDGVEITPKEFFEKIETAPSLPTTAAPSIGAFTEVYKDLTGKGHEVVSLHVSGKLSATLSSATQAAAELGNEHISVVDTQAVSAMEALIVTAAARVAIAGGSVEEVIEKAKSSIDKTAVYVVLDTLEYLQKGGRIGRAAALMGGLLSIKPILTLNDGEVHPHEKVRTRAKALARIIEIVQSGGPYEEITVMHASAKDEAEYLTSILEPMCSGLPILSSQIGPVVGTHAGPGSVAVATRTI
ncbi:MAG: DegV family protein [Chloroflexota bacterium]|nr:DegV family protein [Chloroflexota bacterium]